MTAIDGVSVVSAGTRITVGFVDQDKKAIQVTQAGYEDKKKPMLVPVKAGPSRRWWRVTYRVYPEKALVSNCDPNCETSLEKGGNALWIVAEAERLCNAANGQLSDDLGNAMRNRGLLRSLLYSTSRYSKRYKPLSEALVREDARVGELWNKDEKVRDLCQKIMRIWIDVMFMPKKEGVPQELPDGKMRI